MKTLYLVSFFLLIYSQMGWAQVEVLPPISGTFRGMSFEQFAQVIERQSPYRFYFAPNQLDSVQVNISVQEQSLRDVLKQVFENSGFSFAIDPQGKVFVVKGREIRDELPANYFSPTLNTERTYDAVIFDFMGGDPNQKAKEEEAKLYEIGKRNNNLRGTANLAGYVRDIESGEPLIGALVFIEDPRIGVATNAFGYYSITLPKGRHILKVKSIGVKNTQRQIMLYEDGKLDIETEEEITPLKEVLIEAEKDANVVGLQMGRERLDVKAMKQIPMAFGEADILKVVLTLPGVKSVGENSTGLNVRGGAADQNLILYNDATIYNPSHLFGFFSAFNSDVLKNVELYKSGVPAEYGGRLSSILEVSTREGNKKKYEASGGIGLITGRLTVEGPLVKDKTAFVLGVRSTYSDWLLRALENENFNNSTASFYDINAHVSHELNENNSLYLTAYASNDQFRLDSDTLYRYQNQAATVRWKHVFNNQLYGVFSGGMSRYQFSISSEDNPVNAYQIDYDIRQSQAKADFSYFPATPWTINFGASSIYYQMYPGEFRPLGDEALGIPLNIAREQALENAFYAGAKWEVNRQLTLYAGLRYSIYSALGPRNLLEYAPNLPLSDNTVTGSRQVDGALATYHGPEWRASARYGLSSTSSLKFSYNRMRQYISMLSNTVAISPTDTWKLSDPYVRPQVADQVSLGFYQNLRNNTVEASMEVYYKDLKNVLDFKSGAVLLLNPAIEQDVVQADGKAYGVELLFKKVTGKLNGWIAYTYSRSLLRTQSPFAAETINLGQWYPSNFDKPHDVTLISNYKFNRRFSMSLNFTYSTGRPITLPLGKYVVEGQTRLFYSERNQFRIPDYYRADFSLNIEGNHKVRKLAHSSWTIAVYNLTGRRNAFSVFFQSEGTQVKGYQLSIFGQPIPTLTYNFKI